MATEKEKYASIFLKRIYNSEFLGEKVFLTAGKTNQKFPIHTVVLAASSKYFTASLGPNFQEAEKEEFVLEGADSDTVKAIVNYCYEGEIDLNEENVGKYLAIASSVQLDMLEAACRRFYEEKLSITNCVDALMVADKYSYADIRQKAFDFLCDNFDKTPSAEIQKLDHRLFQELLEHDEIHATEEIVVLKLLEWYRGNEEIRKPYMQDSLKLIRLEVISHEFLSDTLEAIYEEFNCSKIAFAEYKRRSSIQCSNVGVYRSRARSIFHLFLQFKRENGAKESAIKIEKFNPILNCYEEAGQITLGDRINFSVILQKNKIYVLGGCIRSHDSTGHMKSVSVFDLVTGEETILCKMNVARSFCAPILYGKYIYVTGGFSGSDSMSSCERFDTEKNTWTIIKGMNIARNGHSITQFNDYVCVGGGYSSGGKTESVELYDPIKDEWTRFATMNKARYGFAMAEPNGFLCAMGDDADIEIFDSWQNCWTKVGSFKDSELITSTVNIHGDTFVIMRNGKFGRITKNGSGPISFVKLAKSKYESNSLLRHYLSHN